MIIEDLFIGVGEISLHVTVTLLKVVRNRYNTPGIIKYPFWRMTADNPQAVYACVNYGEAFCPEEIADRSIVVNAEIDFSHFLC